MVVIPAKAGTAVAQSNNGIPAVGGLGSPRSIRIKVTRWRAFKT